MPELEKGLTLRPATNADCSEIRELVFGILDEYGLEPDTAGTDRDLLDIESSYFDRGGIFEVLVDDDGRIVGTAGLYPVDSKTIELRKMYFAPQIRGRGLGKKLLAAVIEKSKEMGYLRVYLETASVLKQAVHIYEAAGFKPVDVKHTPRCDQAYVLELFDR